MRRFAGIELGDDRIPDETTILNFRHLLEQHGLTDAIFAEVNAHLADKGITLRPGTLVDATIIDAPSPSGFHPDATGAGGPARIFPGHRAEHLPGIPSCPNGCETGSCSAESW